MSTVRVLVLADGIGATVCGRLFAGFGQDVIERRPATTDRHAVEALIDGADVVVSDRSARAEDELGWDDGTRTARWPRLVWVSVTGFGRDGALGELPDDSLLAESFGGLAQVVGDPQRSPLALGGEQAAHAAGFAAYLAARLALLRRERTGRGDLVDVAYTDLAAFMDWKSDVAHDVTGEVAVRNATTGWWRVLPARDGYVGMIYHDNDWPRLVQLIGDDRLADPRFAAAGTRIAAMDEWLPIVADWVAARSAREAYEQAQRVGLPFGYDADMAELGSAAQYRARGFVPARDDPAAPAEAISAVIGAPWQITGVTWDGARAVGAARSGASATWRPDRRRTPTARRAAPASEPSAPLDGLVVLDLGTITAGAATGRLLADYGATVIKVENPQRPDAFRHWASASGAPTDVSPLFEANNAGKSAVSLDLKTDEGRRAFGALIERADVVLENFRAGVTARLGVSFDHVRRRNPALIYLSLASQGQDGPEAGYSSYGSTLDLLSGLGSVTGYPGGPPVWSSYLVNYPDQLAALVGAALVVHCRAEGLQGVHIDLSQRELVTWTLADLLREQLEHGRTAVRTGNRRPGASPHDTYRCDGPDRWVAISCRSDKERRALSGVLSRAIETADPDAADAAISAWTAGRTREQCVAALRGAGVPCVPVLDAADRAREPHFRDRRVFLPGPSGVRTRGFPFVMRGFRPPTPSPAPAVGEHNTEWLA